MNEKTKVNILGIYTFTILFVGTTVLATIFPPPSLAHDVLLGLGGLIFLAIGPPFLWMYNRERRIKK